MGLINNQAAGTDRLQGESFKYGGNEIKYGGNYEQILSGERKAIKTE